MRLRWRVILLGTAFLFLWPQEAEGLPPRDPAPDTTRPAPRTSAFDPEAGQLLRRYVGVKAYGAHSQNWDAAQDTSGVFYVANTEGLLVYDGHAWRTVSVANQSVVRSVTTNGEGRVFIGATGDFGVLRPDSVGRMQFVSLLDHVPDGHRTFSEVWRTTSTEQGVYFQSAEQLFRWSPRADTMRTWTVPGTTFQYGSAVRDTFFVGVKGRGLMAVRADSLRLVPGGRVFSDRTVRFVLPHGEHGLLVGTENQLFVRDGASFRPFPTGADSLLRSAWVYKGKTLPDGTIALATIDRGLLLLAPDGTVRRRLEARGKPVIGLYADREGGLWALLHGGMLRYDVGAPFTRFDEESGLKGNPSALARHRGTLYAATIRSVAHLQVPRDTLASFAPVPGFRSQARNTQYRTLLSVGNTLFVGTTNGLLQRTAGGSVRTLFDRPVYGLLHSRRDSARIYAAVQDGVRLFRRIDGRWRAKRRVAGLPASTHWLAEADDGTLWAGTRSAGVYRIRNAGLPDSTTVDHFGRDAGLPPGSVVPQRWNDRVVFGTGAGLLRFVPGSPSPFEPFEPVRVPAWMQGRGSVDLHLDARGRAWGITPSGPGRWVLRDSTWRWTADPLFRLRRDRVITFRVEDDGRTIWIGTRGKGLIRYVPGSTWNRAPMPTRIRRVTATETDSLLAAGGVSNSPPKLDYSQNSIKIAYGTPSLVEPGDVRYQYKLAGSHNKWSEWTTRTEQTLGTLPPGTHTFLVRARLAYGDTTRVARYPFTILPPWYRSWWAYGLYLLAAIGMIVGAVQWRTRQLRRRQEQLEATVDERTRELQARTQELAEEKKKTEKQAERLKELDEAKSRFFANVSHEFRTPLTLILGPARDLRERIREYGTDTDAQQLSTIERNARRLLRLIDQILGIARLEAGTYQLAARPTDVGTEVERVVRTFEPLAEREDLSLTVETSEENGDPAPPVYVDREALEHVLSNLLSNAIKFTPSGGAVEVGVTEETDRVRIAVADTGPGIAEAEQEVIFDRFRQRNDDTAREKGGAGIGLAFAKDLVDLHGGTISVESEKGDGATFIVRVPKGKEHLSDDQIATQSVENEAPGPSPGSASPASPERPVRDGASPSIPSESEAPPVDDTAPDAAASSDEAQGKQILVVDDNPEVRRYVRSVLEPTFSVLEAERGDEGLEAARELLPDVILADVMMPDLDGHEMTRRLKADPETAAIPIIMVTARAGTQNEVEGLQVGADDYVTKPFDATVLRQRVSGVITLQERLRRRVREELQESSPDSAREERSELEEEARQIIRAHLTDPDFDAEALAERMAMSRSTMYERFDEQTDTTPLALIKELRMEKATSLLRDREGTVTQVAYAVGYERLSSFSHAYKEHTGQSPSDVSAEG